MKIKCDIVLDLETGDYEIGFNNLTHRGEKINYIEVQSFLKKIFRDFDLKVEGKALPDVVTSGKILN